MLIEQDKVEPPAGQKVGGPGEYDGEEQMVGGVDPEKDKKQRGENTGPSTADVTSSLYTFRRSAGIMRLQKGRL